MYNITIILDAVSLSIVYYCKTIITYSLLLLILILFVSLLYIILVYCVLIKLKFFRELLKEFGLPIPIEYRELEKDK